MSAKLARSAGIAPAMAFCATLRSRPRAEAIFAIMSGVRNCITTETKFVAMAILPRECSYLLRLVRPVRNASRSLITLYYNLAGVMQVPQKLLRLASPAMKFRSYANGCSLDHHHRLYR